MRKIENVTLLGAGVLGSQIAFQTAFNNFKVKVYDINDEAVQNAKKRFEDLKEIYKDEMNISPRLLENALSNLTCTTNMEEAVKDSDLVIEAVPENIKVKEDTYSQLSKLAPEKTIFATNTSTLLPSEMMDFTGRPDRFIALHFANRIWKHNTAEIMATSKTDPEIYETIVDFARNIGMVPVKIKKEQPGYVLNSLLVPFLAAAGHLLVEGVSDIETIDKTWKIATGSPNGPFEIYDEVGLNTAYNISMTGNEKFAKLIKEEYLDKGKTSFYEKRK